MSEKIESNNQSSYDNYLATDTIEIGNARLIQFKIRSQQYIKSSERIKTVSYIVEMLPLCNSHKRLRNLHSMNI